MQPTDAEVEAMLRDEEAMMLERHGAFQPLQAAAAPSSSSAPAAASAKPTYKWGICSVCSRAMHPCCPASGPHAGQFRTRCNNFNKYENGKRMCWNSGPYFDPIEDLPKMVRSKQASLLGGLSFQFRQG